MPTIRARSAEARPVLATTVLGSGLVFLDSTVVNIALPTIDRDLDAGLTGLQWTIDGYLVTLTALLLLGGSLGDRFGRRRLFRIGLVAFTAASVACALAPNVAALVAARACQGIGGAMLVPGSLAIISASFHPEDRGWAIGAWSGMAGVSTAIAPFLGGWLIDAISWRAVFLINVPLAALAGWFGRNVPESRDPDAPPRIDVAGAVLGAIALGAIAYALIEEVAAPGVLGVVALVAFLGVEATREHPMLPLGIFGSRQFVGANLATFAMYGGLGGATFLVVLELQNVLGYSALEAGAALLPMSLLLLAFSARAGRLAQRIGPRLPMTIGPLIAAVALVGFARIDASSHYVPAILGAATLFGVGLVITVSPLTTTVITAVDDRWAGLASGVNNAVARGAGLLAVAFLPAVTDRYRLAMELCALACLAGGVVAWATIRNPTPRPGSPPG